MDFIEVVRNHRSVREYTTKLIERAQIERLKARIMLAAYARSRQLWVFAALFEQERVAQCGQEAKSWLLANISETTFDAAPRHALEDPAFALFHGAPALVLGHGEVLGSSSYWRLLSGCRKPAAGSS